MSLLFCISGARCPICDTVQGHSYCTTPRRENFTVGNSYCNLNHVRAAEAPTEEMFYALTNYTRPPRESVYVGKPMDYWEAHSLPKN